MVIAAAVLSLVVALPARADPPAAKPAGKPEALGKTRELFRAVAPFGDIDAKDAPKTMLVIDVLVPAAIKDEDLVAVADHYRTTNDASAVVRIEYWDDAAAYRAHKSEPFDDAKKARYTVTNHRRALYDKDPLRKVHRLTVTKPAANEDEGSSTVIMNDY